MHQPSASRQRLQSDSVPVRLCRDDADRLHHTGRPFATYAGQCAHAWIDYLHTAYPGQNLLSAPMHDALAVAVISEPNLVTGQPARVHVETASRLTRGVTVADLLTSRDAPTPNCQIATQVDAAAFMDLFLKHLAQL